MLQAQYILFIFEAPHSSIQNINNLWNMGYRTRAEYTIELIKNPKSYNYIDNQFFATGFILASGMDEFALTTILEDWKEIDLITANRIRFLFYIENETVLSGYPQQPYFTQSGYKKYNSKLLDLANQYKFEVDINPGHQMTDGYAKRAWHPEEKVLKLAYALGISQSLPLLAWTISSDSNTLYYISLKGLSPKEISLKIRDFCVKFYDNNYLILTAIDKIESAIETKSCSIQATIKTFSIFKAKLDEVLMFKKHILNLKGIDWQGSWLLSLLKLKSSIQEVVSLIAFNDLIDKSLLKSIIGWIDSCTFIDAILTGKIDLSNTHVPAIYRSLSAAIDFNIKLPEDAIHLSTEKSFYVNNEILQKFFLVFNIPILCLDLNSGSNQKLIDRIKRLESFYRHKFNNQDFSSFSEHNKLVTLINLLVTTDALVRVQIPTEQQINYYDDLRRVVATNFYKITTASGATAHFWIYYKYNEVLKNIESYMNGVLGMTEVKKNEAKEIDQLLSKVNESVKKLDFSCLKSYEIKPIADLNLLNVKDNNLATKLAAVSISEEFLKNELEVVINNELVPIHHVMRSMKPSTLSKTESEIFNKVCHGINQLQIINTRQYIGSLNDQYNVNQAGAVGPNAQVHNSTFNQVSSGVNSGIDVVQLAKELTELRQALSQKATEPGQFVELGHVAAAEQAATAGDSNKAVEYLKKVGTWVWDTATKIGVGVAMQAIKSHLGL